jgi:hypothetical protein
MMRESDVSAAYRGLEPTTAHVSEETWEALMDGTLASAKREAALDHVVGCHTCATVYRGLVMFERESQTLGAPAHANAPDRLPFWSWAASPWRPIGLAALAAAAVFSVVWLAPRRPPVDDRSALRGNGAAMVNGLSATIGADRVPSLAWTPLPAATSYRVGLFSADGQPVWTREVEKPPARWPDDVPRAVGAYSWRVEALAAGVVVARSRLTALEIAR